MVIELRIKYFSALIVSCYFLLTGCISRQEEGDGINWLIRFEEKGSIIDVALKGNDISYSRNNNPVGKNVSSPEFVSESRPASLLSRFVNGETLVVGPEVSGVFFIKSQESGKVAGEVKTGHSYSSVVALSPHATYVMYVKPGSFQDLGTVVIQKSNSHITYQLEISPKARLIDWVDQSG